jgi:hypothetical protein
MPLTNNPFCYYTRSLEKVSRRQLNFILLQLPLVGFYRGPLAIFPSLYARWDGLAISDPFFAAQLSNAVLAAQAFQHNADLLLSRMMPACALRISRTVFSALSGTRLLACLIVAPQRATMSQKSPLTQSTHSVRQVLTAYTRWRVRKFAHGRIGGLVCAHLADRAQTE